MDNYTRLVVMDVLMIATLVCPVNMAVEVLAAHKRCRASRARFLRYALL